MLVSDPVRSQGISLAPVGMNETVWPIGFANSVVAALRDGGYAILGGDIYLKKFLSFVPAYEN